MLDSPQGWRVFPRRDRKSPTPRNRIASRETSRSTIVVVEHVSTTTINGRNGSSVRSGDSQRGLGHLGLGSCRAAGEPDEPGRHGRGSPAFLPPGNCALRLAMRAASGDEIERRRPPVRPHDSRVGAPRRIGSTTFRIRGSDHASTRPRFCCSGRCTTPVVDGRGMGPAGRLQSRRATRAAPALSAHHQAGPHAPPGGPTDSPRRAKVGGKRPFPGGGPGKSLRPLPDGATSRRSHDVHTNERRRLARACSPVRPDWRTCTHPEGQT